MRKVTILTGMILIASTLFVNAQRGRGYNNPDRPMMKQNCQIPDLTDTQEEKIKDLRTSHWNEMKEFRADMNILRAERQKLEVSGNPNAKAIDAKIDEMGKLRTQMQKASNHHRLAVRELLTDDQKAWFDSRNHRRGGKGFGRGHGRRGHGAGYGAGCRGGIGYGAGYGAGRGYGQGAGYGMGYGRGAGNAQTE